MAGVLSPAGAALAATGAARVGVDLLAECDADAFDVNGDGINDLAIGVPGENVGKAKSGVNAGAVTIVYGVDAFTPYGSNGSTVLKAEDVGQKSERGDRFGASLLVADVNGDSCRDLVIGVPGEDKGRGRVMIMFGSGSGLAGHQSLHQDRPGVPGKAEKGDGFGGALAVSGVVGGGLWVASPNENVGKTVNAGLVTRFPFGVAGGNLPSTGITNYSGNSAGIPGSKVSGARFGSVLLGTDSMLAIGVPRQRVDGKGSAGAVFTLKTGWKKITQGNGAGGTVEKGDRFGAALAMVSCPGASGGAFAVGSPGEKVKKIVEGGTVTLIAGSESSVVSQNTSGVPNKVEKGDLFGRSLAGIGRTLAVGVPEENYNGKKNAGLVAQLKLDCSGAPAVADAVNIKPLHANSGDRFGLILGAGTLQPTVPVRAMLFVGSPQEAGTGAVDSGTVAAFEDPEDDGLFTKRASLLSQSNVAGKSEKSDFFGGSIAAA